MRYFVFRMKHDPNRVMIVNSLYVPTFFNVADLPVVEEALRYAATSGMRCTSFSMAALDHEVEHTELHILSTGSIPTAEMNAIWLVLNSVTR